MDTQSLGKLSLREFECVAGDQRMAEAVQVHQLGDVAAFQPLVRTMRLSTLKAPRDVFSDRNLSR